MVTQLVLAVGLLQASADKNPAPFSLANPPAQVERLLAGERLSKDDAAAAQKDCFRPYFPLVVMSDVGLAKGPAREVFAGYYLARHKDRRDRWVKEGRFDLLADSMVVTARGSTDLADQFAGEWAEILPELLGEKAKGVVRDKLGAKSPRREEADDRFGLLATNTVAPLGKLLAEPQYVHTVAAPVVSICRYGPGDTPARTIDIRATYANAATFSDRLVLTSSDTSGSMHLVGGDVVCYRHPKAIANVHQQEFRNELLLVNGSVGCRNLYTSVIIADGDVTLHRDGSPLMSVVIARGDICTAEDVEYLSAPASLFVAGGKIRARRLGGQRDPDTAAMLLACGGVELDDEKRLKKPDPMRKASVVLEGVGPADLGVSWFELSDVGLEVTSDLWSVQVKAVADKSPFHGQLEAKDVLLEINTIPVGCPHEVRHALRRAYTLGFAVVTFERAGKVQWKMIPIGDLMEAPPPKKDDKK